MARLVMLMCIMETNRICVLLGQSIRYLVMMQKNAVLDLDAAKCAF